MNSSPDALTFYFLNRAEGSVILLESQSQEHPSSNITYLAALPEADITAYGRTITIRTGNDHKRFREDPWKALSDFRGEHGGWLFGYFGYDLKNHIEDLESCNSDPVGAPDMYFMAPRFLLRIDRKRDGWQVIRGSLPEEIRGSGSGEPLQPGLDIKIGDLKPATDRTAYIEKIREAQRLIGEGVFYEINLSHQLGCEFSGSPYELYRRMRGVGPVPFAGFMQWEHRAVCCLSPERFLRKRGTEVYSQPIKGTARRSDDPDTDRQHRDQLLASRKEQAENLMIVDLVRNDLSRIAVEGSVSVPELFEIQSFGTVHQMVSTVRAVAAENDPVAIIRACFPMGSMTGAPKISAMKWIENLEDYRRGIYSGAMGYIGPDGNFDFNVVIRTAIIRTDTGRLYYPVGGAITSDSDPDSEWEETIVKARALTGIG